METFDRPFLDPRKTPEQNLTILERWASDLVDKLNLMQRRISEEGDE